MQISSNSLFHFTEKDPLMLIIKSGKIYGKYCVEKITYVQDTKLSKFVVPMISFCDIPLETYVNTPGNKYGFYALVLKKTWGFKNGFNPVLYMDKNSSVNEMMRLVEPQIESFSDAIYDKSKVCHQGLLKLEEQAKNVTFVDFEAGFEESKEIENNKNNILAEVAETKRKLLIPKFFIKLLEFMKPYEGDLVRDSQLTKDYRFYDEMEWRYVPDRTKVTPEIQIYDAQSLSFKRYKELPIEERFLFSLDFDYNDIECFVVKTRSDISEFTSFIRNLEKFSREEKETLCRNIKIAEEHKNSSQ